jgi:hypothetical protein
VVPGRSATMKPRKPTKVTEFLDSHIPPASALSHFCEGGENGSSTKTTLQATVTTCSCLAVALMTIFQPSHIRIGDEEANQVRDFQITGKVTAIATGEVGESSVVGECRVIILGSFPR